jgi:hypothetical protein
MNDPSVDLSQTWATFCDLFRESGEVVLREGTPDDALDHAEGYRMLTRLVRAGLENFLESRTPLHPELVCTCHETMKIVGDNPDNLYLGASIDGTHDYRIFGDLGSARWVSFNTFDRGSFGAGGTGMARALYREDLVIPADAPFELWLSSREHEGNWLPLRPETRSVVIRQTFADVAAERVGDLHIECLDVDGPPAPLSTDDLALGLLAAGHYVREVSRLAARWAEANAATPNRFVDVDDGFAEAKLFADPQILYHQAYVELEPGERLVVEVDPPECTYWMFVLHNHWMESLDYVHHQVHLNDHTARRNPDGSVRLVVAHDDPGEPNWLDTAGHRRTILGVRWVGPDVADVVPTTHLRHSVTAERS